MFNLHLLCIQVAQVKASIHPMGLSMTLKLEGKNSTAVLHDVEYLAHTHRSKHYRLYDVFQKGGKLLLCDVECDSERQT